MFSLTLTSKNTVHALKKRLRDACEKQGLRLGRSDEKIDRILPELFGVKDINALYALAETSDNKTPVASYDVRSLSGSTGAQEELIKSILKTEYKDKGIKSVTVGRRLNVGNNDFGITWLIETTDGHQIQLNSNLTMERKPRELEVLNVFYQIRALGLISKTYWAIHSVADETTREQVPVSEWTTFPISWQLAEANSDTKGNTVAQTDFVCTDLSCYSIAPFVYAMSHRDFPTSASDAQVAIKRDVEKHLSAALRDDCWREWLSIFSAVDVNQLNQLTGGTMDFSGVTVTD